MNFKNNIDLYHIIIKMNINNNVIDLYHIIIKVIINLFLKHEK